MGLVIYSCFCLFDTCLLSYQNKESYKQFMNRVYRFIQGEYNRERKAGLCGCFICRTPRYTHNYWNEHLYSSDYEWYYICCNDRAHRHLSNIELTFEGNEDIK